MSSLENILSNFYFEQVDKPGNKYPKFGKAGRQDYIFTCKLCGSQSEPMYFHPDMRYRLAMHLSRYCKPVSSSDSEEEEQGPAEEEKESKQIK